MMKKIIKWVLIVVVALIGIGTVGMYFMKKETKSHSPEELVKYATENNSYEVFYCRPSKKGREIFGDLVPFDQVWRTGANEATTFTIEQHVEINGEVLRAGTYSLWTIPGKSSWQVIFNTGEYGWGVSWGGVASRDPNLDVLTIEVPVVSIKNEVEQFTIYFEDVHTVYMHMMWDQTQITVPITEL